MFPSLLAHIRRFVDLSDEEGELFLSLIQYKEVKKKDYLLDYGHVCTANFFVLKGCIRFFAINERGHELNLQFGIENCWITDYDSFEYRKPSKFHIQAVEDCELIKLGRNEKEELFRHIPQLERYFRIVLQNTFTASQRRFETIFSISAEGRYRRFSQDFPELVQRIPQYMLASYLQLTPEFISKLRTKRKKV